MLGAVTGSRCQSRDGLASRDISMSILRIGKTRIVRSETMGDLLNCGGGRREQQTNNGLAYRPKKYRSLLRTSGPFERHTWGFKYPLVRLE